jgi:hypothetical protein
VFVGFRADALATEIRFSQSAAASFHRCAAYTSSGRTTTANQPNSVQKAGRARSDLARIFFRIEIFLSCAVSLNGAYLDAIT